MNDPFEALASMKATLEEGLALLDSVSVEDAAGLDALARVAAAVAGGPDPASLRAAVEPGRLDDFDDQLEELMRLNAVLTRAAALDRDRLSERLKNVRTSRRDLSYYAAGTAGSGERCDLSA